jgi:hypothetical protein
MGCSQYFHHKRKTGRNPLKLLEAKFGSEEMAKSSASDPII